MSDYSRKFPQQPLIDVCPDGEYRLFGDYLYNSHLDGHLIVVPEGFIYDGASVPRLAWSFMPPDGLHRAAALVHDFLYVHLGRMAHRTYTRAEADKIFYLIMRDSGVSYFRAKAAYLAVRAGGWTYWNL